MKTEIVLLIIGIIIGAGVTEFKMCKNNYSLEYGCEK